MSSRTNGDWKSIELRDVGKIVTGSTPSKARQEYYGGDFPFVKPGELLHCPVSDSVDRLSDAGTEVADVAPAGGVLVSCIGNLGKTGIATRPVAFNQQINAIIPHVPEHSKWVFYAVQTPDFVSQMAAVSSATTIAIVNKGKFSTLRIPFAPENEQRRIVAEIEKQFTRLEAGVAALRRVQANLKRYRAAVLKAACEGRLVQTEAELANTEKRKAKFQTGEDLLAHILTERRQNWQGRGQYKGPAAPDTANISPVSEGWTIASIDQLAADTMIGLDRGRAQQSDSPASGVPYIKMNNVTMDGRVFFDDLVYVPASQEEVTRFAIEDGDILFNTRNSKELVGKVGLVRNPPTGAIYNNNLMRIRLAGGVSPAFLSLQMCSHEFRRRMELVKKATTNVAAVYAKDLLPLAIALPPLTEQTRIVAEVERRLSVIDELETVVSANLHRAARLRQSILQKAFTGNLVGEASRTNTTCEE